MSGFAAYTRATTWMYGALTSPPIAGVLDAYEEDAPEGVTSADSIWIEFELQQPGTDVAEVAEQRIWTEFAFLVRVISRGRSTAALATIADTIDARLHRQSGTTADGQVISATRDREVQDSWLKEGVEYRALGGIYNLIVQPLNP